jgi:hypothetical protein
MKTEWKDALKETPANKQEVIIMIGDITYHAVYDPKENGFQEKGKNKFHWVKKSNPISWKEVDKV